MLKKRARFWLATTIVFSLLALSFACGGKKDETGGGGGEPETTGGAKWAASPDKEGTITGTIALKGDAPAPQKIDMNADTNCAQKNPNATTETVMAKDGKLQNVFVYIKDGTLADGKKIGDYSFDPPSPQVTLDQNGCHYVPHILGMMLNQKLVVKNSDPTTHNVHATPKTNEEWNEQQAPGAPDISKSFKRSEILVPVKCNVHNWMKAYIGVLKHPFFAVSGEDGSFTLKNVPAGTYTVVAWHEKYGEKTAQVKVDAKGTATATFDPFDTSAAASNQPSSLEMMPAMELPSVGHH